MDNDFGYFLISIGLMWIIIVTPFDASFMNNTLALPIGLIIIGGVSIVLGLLHVNHVSGLLLAVFIALLIKSFTFPFIGIPGMHGSLSETSILSFASSKDSVINYSCAACSDSINASGSNALKITTMHVKGVELDGTGDINNIMASVKFNNSIINNGAESTIMLPIIFNELNYDTGVGSLTLNPESVITINAMNISTGVGSLNLEMGNVNASVITASTGVGSVEVSIPRINHNTQLNLHSGVGSINVIIAEGIDYKLDLKSGLGSAETSKALQSAGYDNASIRILITASTGVGSISIK